MSNFLPEKLHQLKFSSVVCEEVIFPPSSNTGLPSVLFDFFWLFDSLWCLLIQCITKRSFTALISASLIYCNVEFFLNVYCSFVWEGEGIISSDISTFVQQMASHCFNFPTVCYLCGQTLHEFIYYWEDCLCALPIF